MDKRSRAKWKGEWERPDFPTLLKPYIGKKQYFFHLSDLGPNQKGPVGDRFGLNPKQPWRTPFGIYGYPFSREFAKHLLDGTLPFRASSPWVHIFQANLSKCVIASKYTKAQYQKDRAKVLSMSKVPLEGWTILTPDDTVLVGYDWVDVYEGDIDVSQLMKTKWEAEIVLKDVLSEDSSLWGSKVHKISWWEDKEEEAPIETPAGMLWHLTHTFVPHIYGGEHNIVGWNKLFRVLGYEGFIDDSCDGIIHPNEKCQAVFFTSGVVKRLDVIPNPSVFKNWSLYSKQEDTRYLRPFKKGTTTKYLPSMGVVDIILEQDEGEGKKVGVIFERRFAFGTPDNRVFYLGLDGKLAPAFDQHFLFPNLAQAAKAAYLAFKKLLKEPLSHTEGLVKRPDGKFSVVHPTTRSGFILAPTTEKRGWNLYFTEDLYSLSRNSIRLDLTPLDANGRKTTEPVFFHKKAEVMKVVQKFIRTQSESLHKKYNQW